MKRRSLITFALIAISLVAIESQTPAQGPNSNPKTSSKMLYHNGPLRTGRQNMYFIFYGCWGMPACGAQGGDWATMIVPLDFSALIGNSPYLAIDTTYTDGAGQPATGTVIAGGYAVDSSYSHGADITKADIEAIILDQFTNFRLPPDPQGIYVVLASADIASNETGFCSPGAPPFHSYFDPYRSTYLPYIFLGNPNRCQTVAGAPFFSVGGTGLLTPNGNFAGDAMVLNLAHALNGLLTDPFDTGWYDRYGLENADKCTGTLGQTFTAANGARANLRLAAGHDFLVEQNWVNDRRSRCALSQ